MRPPGGRASRVRPKEPSPPRGYRASHATVVLLSRGTGRSNGPGCRRHESGVKAAHLRGIVARASRFRAVRSHPLYTTGW